MGATVFERLVCLKDWIDAENRMQYKELEASTSGVDTQESGAGTEADNESDDECDPEEESGLWYMKSNY